LTNEEISLAFAHGMSNKPKRNHHIVPELYLKGFVIKNDEPFIWVYKRGEPYNPGNGKITNNPYKDSIRNAGAEKDFYADPKEGSVKDFETFENILESLEKPANPIFQKLRARQMISNEEKCLFSHYIILMHRRVRSGREKVKNQLSKHPYEPSKALFQKTNLPDTPETRAELKKVSDNLAQKEGFEIQAHNRITAAVPDSFLIEVLQKMTWSFYVAPMPHTFVTSDNPVFISEKFGLGKNISELSFPISADIALIASWNRFLKEEFSEAKPQLLKELNRRTINAASQHVYFSKNPEWVKSILDKNFYEYRPTYSVKSVYTVAKIITEPPDSKPRVEISI
jgi:uncharacterized protein DUF4238